MTRGPVSDTCHGGEPKHNGGAAMVAKKRIRRNATAYWTLRLWLTVLRVFEAHGGRVPTTAPLRQVLQADTGCTGPEATQLTRALAALGDIARGDAGHGSVVTDTGRALLAAERHGWVAKAVHAKVRADEFAIRQRKPGGQGVTPEDVVAALPVPAIGRCPSAIRTRTLAEL
jgi:hypothetical protein